MLVWLLQFGSLFTCAYQCLSCLTISCESLAYITASWSVSHSPLLHVPTGTSVAVKGEREEKKTQMEKGKEKRW